MTCREKTNAGRFNRTNYSTVATNIPLGKSVGRQELPISLTRCNNKAGAWQVPGRIAKRYMG